MADSPSSYPQDDNPRRGARRRSTWFRNRASIVVVESVRTTPYRIVCLVTGCMVMCIGLRDVFFCDAFLTADGIEQELMGDCRHDKNQEFLVAMMGIAGITHGILRLECFFVEHVAILYRTMWKLVLSDLLYLFIFYRRSMEETKRYAIVAFLGLVIDSYVFYKARAAHIARSKGPKIKSSYE